MVLRRWSHGLALVVSLSTLLLLLAGALVTSTGSSLAVPDWPLAYGQLFPPMVGGIFYEHGHRLVATTVGFLTVVLGGWLWWAERRKWVKWLGLAAVGLVILQGVMGGITVLLLLPKAVSIAHAMLAQVFFLWMVALSQFTSPGWERLVSPARGRVTGRTALWGGITLGALFVELALGATMRHNSAGLAIPDFPLAYGGIVPPLTSFPIVIHFSHRVGAVVVLALVFTTLWVTLRSHRQEPALVGPAVIMAVLVVVQVSLGALSIWTVLAVPVTIFHLANGAVLIGITGLLTLRGRILENSRTVDS